MPAYKDSKTGTWFVKFYCKDWTGENKQIKKRGFATKREALDYERNYKIRQENNLDMTFGEFWKLYTEDVKNYVKLNTWLTKEHIVDTKILPYFKNLKMNEITSGDVVWGQKVPPKHENGGKKRPQNYKVGAESAPAQIRAEKVWGQKVPSKCKSGGKKRRQNSKVMAKSATTQMSEKKVMVAESAIEMEKWWRKMPSKQ